VADIGSLIVKIGADASGLEKAFTQLLGNAQQFQKGLETISKVGTTAFIATTTAAVAMTVAAAHQAEELEALSSITGMNTDKLQVYEVMLSRVGLTGDDLALVMKKLSTSFSQAQQGVGSAGDRFKQLGINIKAVTDTDDLIRKITTTSAQFADGLEKDAVMTDLLGRGWKVLLKAFQEGSAGIDAATAASKNLGQTLSTSQIEALKGVDKSIADLMTSMTRFGQQLGVFMTPSVVMVTKALTDLFAWGSKAFDQIGLQADIFGVRFTHLGLKMAEVGNMVFSTNIFSGAAWKQMAANLDFIDKEADKQIAKLRTAAAMVHAPAAQDMRPKMPAFVDTAKASEQNIKLIDEELKASQAAFASQDQMAKAAYANHVALLEAAKQAGIRTDEEVALARQADDVKMAAFTQDLLQRELANYRTFIATKMTLFADSKKGEEERARFVIESGMKEKQLIDQIGVATIQADTQRIQSGAAVLAATKITRLKPLEDEIALAKADFDLQEAFYKASPLMMGGAMAVREKALALLNDEVALRRQVIEQTIADEQRKNTLLIALDTETQAKRMGIIQQYPTFFQKQMQDIVASNTFSVSQIISAWTGGLANAIVHGGKVAVAAWDATKMAIVQGAINMGVQLAAQWALQAAVKAGFMTASASKELMAWTALESAKTSVTTAEETARSAILLAATKAASVASALALTGVIATGVAAIGVLGTVLEAIVGFMLAVAASVAGTPIIGQALAGSIIVGATLAQVLGGAALTTAASALTAAATASAAKATFSEGGIGNFGSGTPAMLHGPEAIIPLNQQGASFMREAFGGGNGGGEQTIIVPVHLDGRQIARSTVRHTPGAWRSAGAPA